jgi:hypothetical protein
VRGVVRCLAPRRRSSLSLSRRLLSRLLCESVALIHSERGRGWLNIHFAKWILSPSQNFYTLWLLQITFDHSSYSINLWKCKRNYDILKIYIMIKHVIVK